jgi:hypothetical protein
MSGDVSRLGAPDRPTRRRKPRNDVGANHSRTTGRGIGHLPNLPTQPSCYAQIMITLLFALATAVALGSAPGERSAMIVAGPQPPVRITHAAVLTANEGPPVVLYSAVNQTDKEYEQFTVTAFVFKTDGTPRARQTAPGRRTLEPHETKYSTIVLDGAPVEATDIIVIGIDQAQLAGSEEWWHTDLRPLAEAAVPAKK